MSSHGYISIFQSLPSIQGKRPLLVGSAHSTNLSNESICTLDNRKQARNVLCYSASMSTTVTRKDTAHPLYSIGHGNRSIEPFLALLLSFGIKYLTDVRSYPSSKRNPHFNRKNLEVTLGKAGISYGWFPNLGGFRREGLGSKSPHLALQRKGFRNYADYMRTESFRSAAYNLSRLVSLGPACFMCAETVPQRCHRLFISDFLLVHGIKVIHILDSQRTTVHELSRLATISKGRILYNRIAP